GTAQPFGKLPVTVKLPSISTSPMNWPARAPGVVVKPKTPMLLENPMTPTLAFEVPITPCCCWSDVPTTAAMFGVLGPSGPVRKEMPRTPFCVSETPMTPGPPDEPPMAPTELNEKPRTPAFPSENPITPGWFPAAPRTPAWKLSGRLMLSSTWPQTPTWLTD